MQTIRQLKFFSGGKFLESTTEKYSDIYDPSTGEVIARTPCCTVEELNAAVLAAKEAYPVWSNMSPSVRAQLYFRLKNLVDKNIDDLTYTLARENGKNWNEAAGDVIKAREMIEMACNIPNLMMGESLMNASAGYDVNLYREPMGVFAGIAPFNFPAMLPIGWMAALATACGNTYVLKAASRTPMTSLKFAELFKEAGFPDGVLNIVTCSRNEAELLLEHPDIEGITFIGSTEIGLQVYSKAAKYGKRVQALCEAKNHGLVLKDAPITRTAAGIINSAFGCAGERCMALPVIVVQEDIADKLVAELLRLIKMKKIGPAYDKSTDLGPLISKEHKKFVCDSIQKGVDEGAVLVLDGLNVVVPGYENGYYLGHTILDHVTPDMTVGDFEIFGPVLCIKRVKTFDEGVEVMNKSPFGNGSVIFTQNGFYAREFARRSNAGMVGINVGIPIPMSIFPFTGHKRSFFGDLHTQGKDFIRFYTEGKTVTTHWFSEKEKIDTKVSTWDGTI